MKIFQSVITSLIALALVVVLNMKMGDIPPIGKFLDPFSGFWQNAEGRAVSKQTDIKVRGLKGSVEIAFDDKMIPHIFADDENDLYFAQGYITAKDRLWQMDFQTRFASGRLSEVVGPKAIDLDKYQRRMGMLYGAENMVKMLDKDPQIKQILESYVAGVNAYIHSLSPRNYPIEFKILNYKPEDWKLLNTALVLKLMSASLAGGSDEFFMSNILKKYGPDITRDLFPDYPVLQKEPVIPTGTPWNFKPVSIPAIPADDILNTSTPIRTNQKREGIGSNNWAISGSRSATGYPMLENDPHLDLSLPSIWYQVQLSSGKMNVYGVTIPGSPCVIIGYNQKVAWGVTNTYADVLDWYSVKFKDRSNKEYWYNNKWNPVKTQINDIVVRNGKTIHDTVYYTHHGPVVYLSDQHPKNFVKASNIPDGYALRWIAHDGSDDIRTFYQLNKANNYTDYRKALAYFYAPAQNFIFASVDNDIAITPNGYFPLKYKTQGKFLLDGSKTENDWHGRIPSDQNPTVKNPPRGFVSSANQVSTDQTYPYYINWEFGAVSDRSVRINQRLGVMTNATIDSLAKLQLDNYSMLAQNILPTLVNAVNEENLSATEAESYYRVRTWSNFYDAESIGATIFELWQSTLGKMIWEDDFSDPKNPMRFPSRDRTVDLLLNDAASHWFDNSKTPAKETRNDIIQQAFHFTIDSLQRKYGPVGKSWEWGNIKHTNVPHLAKIAGFGSKAMYTGGNKMAINAQSETNGPSWRMIIALSKENKGYGVYPGGESGNPGSFYYDNMIDTWAEGKLNELLFLKSKNENNRRILSRMTLTN